MTTGKFEMSGDPGEDFEFRRLGETIAEKKACVARYEERERALRALVAEREERLAELDREIEVFEEVLESRAAWPQTGKQSYGVLSNFCSVAAVVIFGVAAVVSFAFSGSGWVTAGLAAAAVISFLVMSPRRL